MSKKEEGKIGKIIGRRGVKAGCRSRGNITMGT
jgi:hypothetical protein